MKNLRRRAPMAKPKATLAGDGVTPAYEPMHDEHTTPEFPAVTEPRAYRRTTVTVERETLSVLTRRAFVDATAEPVATPEAHSGNGEVAPDGAAANRDASQSKEIVVDATLEQK